ncbi:MAG TPA: sulfatase-like hydrolase/transferase [Terriglobales bacterium]|nr:sulfatase-like hydrolase/transferase [Terriglobales bacterium]
MDDTIESQPEGHPNRHMIAHTPILKRFLIALSLSNLLFWQGWVRLLDERQVYFDPAWATHGLVVLVTLTVGFALLFVLGVTVAGASRRPVWLSIADWAFLLVVLYAVVRMGTAVSREAGRYWLISWFVTAVVLSLALPVAFLRWRTRIRQILVTGLLIAFPFVLVTFGRTFFELFLGNDRFRDRSTAKLVSSRAEIPRVVWIVFDELDNSVAFTNRPPGLMLPEFDRLRQESLFASNALPPADSTSMSLPALLCGKPVAAARFREDEMLIQFAGTETWVPWSGEQNVFTRARRLGVNSALVGWYHPYCRVIAGTLNACVWDGSPYEEIFQAAPYRQFYRFAAGEIRDVLGRSTTESLSHQVPLFRDQHSFLAEHAKKLVADRSYGLVFVHFSIPHPPAIYDVRQGMRATGQPGYLDNLETADRTLGELRRAMEDAGTWDKSVLLITSDHWWRPSIWRNTALWTDEDEALFSAGRLDNTVPFILRLPGQSKPVHYEERFATVIASDLLTAILKGEVNDLKAAATWIAAANSKVDQTIYTEAAGIQP